MATVSVLYLGQREAIKVTPGLTVGKILEEFCKKRKLTVDNLGLKYKEKPLDLSTPYRLAGLAPGSTLEVYRRSASEASAKVTLAVQLPTGERIQGQFTVSETIWNVLSSFEKEKSLNLLKVTDANGKYRQPVVTYLNREINTNKDLKSLRLSTLGITGSSLVRLSYATSTKTLKEIEEEDEALAKAAAAPPTPSSAPPSTPSSSSQPQSSPQVPPPTSSPSTPIAEPSPALAPIPTQPSLSVAAVPSPQKEPTGTSMDLDEPVHRPYENFKFPSHQQPSSSSSSSSSAESNDERRKEKEEANQGPLPIERNIQVLPPNTREFDPTILDITDELLEPSVDDIKRLLQAEKQRRKQQEEDSVLKTKEMRERERLRKLQRFKKTHIRVRFPDMVELQATFSPHEKTDALIEVVRQALAVDAPFYLFSTPPKERLKIGVKFIDIGLLPAAILHFAWESTSGHGRTYLKQEYLEKMGSGLAAYQHVAELLTRVREEESASTSSSSFSSSSSSSSSSTMPPSAKREKRDHDYSGSSSSSRSGGKVVPKWFASGRKL